MRLVSFTLLAALTLTACDLFGDDSGSNGDDIADAGDLFGDDIADAGETVTVAYTGTLEDGTVFDQSERAEFSLDGVIPGFRDGIIGMEVGETRTFSVPPEEGYGSNPPPGIPPNATLTFEVTLLGVS